MKITTKLYLKSVQSYIESYCNHTILDHTSYVYVTRSILLSKAMKSLTQLVKVLIVISYVLAVFGQRRPSTCNELCGTGIFHAAGICQVNGQYLCWWGWTGPNAVYIDEGEYKNRILADYCRIPCHYTHDHRNQQCLAITTNTPSTTETSTRTSTTTSTTPTPTTQSTTPIQTTDSTTSQGPMVIRRILM